MGTFGLTEAKRREPLPFILRGPFAPAQVSARLDRLRALVRRLLR